MILDKFEPQDVLNWEKEAYDRVYTLALAHGSRLARLGLSFVVTLETNLLTGNELEPYQVKAWEKIPNGYESTLAVVPVRDGHVISVQGQFPGALARVVEVQKRGLLGGGQRAIRNDDYLKDCQDELDHMLELLEKHQSEITASPEDDGLIAHVPVWAKERK